MLKRKAIVLFSGGLDSTACLYWVKERYSDVSLLGFVYGSKEDEVIRKSLNFFSERFNIKKDIIELPFLSQLAKSSGSYLSESGLNTPMFKDLGEFQKFEKEKISQKEKMVWVPGRNLLFLSIASSWADSMKKSIDIIFGANKEEGTIYPDNSLEFVKRMEKAIEIGTLNDIKLIAPFVKNTKKEIAEFMVKQNALIAYSASCYNVKKWTEEGIPIHCGHCEPCMRRIRAFNQANIEDPTIYETKT
ncbi:MAG: 7-cyano-7-deazaguanine synthase [Candidatus Heimdallarchaeum endolithica]|uniref:7-cyano-7-deazaguanine synthase n=1 Tax=Candidatus Heimdallarchaeum endolithica TaxID=2876572 RepID=A0A9Y1BQC6_9ARCH|nr:MAG: 7-cyano-7-deazaguanine synthase [Candidatus Heimdallarchaeum endolithica]